MRLADAAAMTAAAAVALVAATPVSAALSPFHQRLAELGAILADPGITGRLEAHGPIEMIEAGEAGVYTLRAGGCVMTVRTVTVPPPAGEPPMPGPRKFRLAASEPACP